VADSLKRLQAALADRYAVEHEIGSGGMATVYLAQDLRHDRPVAIKVLRPQLAAALGPERFLREIKTTARLHHPHILALHDSGEADGFLYYVMPFVEGESLRDRMTREGQLPLDEALQITREVADALSYAHSMGIVHRDIKPENILLESGHAMVADFGIARAISEGGGERLTQFGLAIGTPAYMSPEQASGEARIDGRSDVYSLACVLYEMLSGEPPHTGPTPQAILARQLTAEVRSLTAVRSSVGPALETAIRRALAVAPADRFATATEFQAAAYAESSAVRRSMRALRVVRKRTARVALAAVGVGALLIGAFLVRGVLVQEAQAGERPVTVAVFPFRASGTDAGALGEGAADLLAAALDGTVGMTVADPAGLWRPLGRSEGAPLDAPELAQALELGRRIAAPYIVLGSITSLGGQVSASVRIYDTTGAVVATVDASAPAESLSHAVNRLAIEVVANLWKRDTLPTVPVIESFATTSIDALQAYLEAKSLKRRGLFREAEQSARRAVGFDSTFALANMELFEIRSWVLFLDAQPFVGLTPIIEAAMRHRDRLTPRNRLRVEAARAMDATDGVQAAALYERILEIDSLDVDAAGGLAFAFLRDGWQMDKGLDDVIDVYRRAARIDSSSIGAYAQLAWLGMLTNDNETVRAALERLRTLDTLSPFVQGRLGTIRVLQEPAADRDRLLRMLAATPAPTVATVLRDLRSLRPQLAERFVDQLLDDTMPVFHQQMGGVARAQLWLAEGKVVAADSLIRTGQLDRVRPTANRFVIAATLLGVGEPAAAGRAALELAAFAPPESLAAYLDTKEDVWATGWAVGAYHASLGDTARARVWQRALGALPRGDTPWDWTGSLTADLEARIAVRRGDLQRAQTEAARAYDLWTIHSGYVGEADPEPALRFHLAQILRQAGASDRAAALFRSFTPPHTWIGFYTARGAIEAAEIAEAEGNREEAVFYYRMAERLWEAGEPAIVGPWLTRVRDGLSRLGAG
jgi:tetratricopeptide (TPR) repeat protein